jgi:hypothetical protein
MARNRAESRLPDILLQMSPVVIEIRRYTSERLRSHCLLSLASQGMEDVDVAILLACKR